MQIQQYLKILQGGWWIIAAMALLFTGVGTAYSYSQTPIYEATATFVVNPAMRLVETYDLLYSMDTLAGRTSLATTYSNIFESRTIINAARQSLGIPSDLLESYGVSSVVLPDSNVIILRVKGLSPDLASDLANAIGSAGVEYISNLQGIYELRYVDRAEPEPEPVSPNHQVDIIMSVIVGLAGGMAFVILRQILTQAFSNEQHPSPLPSHPAMPIASPSDPISITTFRNEP